MGWRIQPFCFLVKAVMKDRRGNKTSGGQQRGEKGTSGTGHGELQ